MSSTAIIILVGVAIAVIWAVRFYLQTASSTTTLVLPAQIPADEKRPLNGEKSDEEDEPVPDEDAIKKMQIALDKVSGAIAEGAKGFLQAEYAYMAVFIVGFGTVLVVFLGLGSSWYKALFSCIAFVVGSITSIISGWIGMYVAVQANVRTTVSAFNSPKFQLSEPFIVAFKAGGVMGFGLVALGLLNLYLLIVIYSFVFPDALADDIEATKLMYECVAGYGLGGSSIALFGRVGGGIYTKAADVGADMAKLDGLEEDDPRNPAVIADNVGDNVGDIAGMGADLFGSFAESSCAAMVISSSSPDLHNVWSAMCFPLLIAAGGIIACVLTSLFATVFPPSTKSDVGGKLKGQLLISTVLMTPIAYVLVFFAFPSSFTVSNIAGVKNWHVFICVVAGLWAGLGIGLVTEYYTSNNNQPTKDLAEKSMSGAATNIIYGLALGYKSTVLPIIFLAITIYISFSLAGMYGVASAALGILSTLTIGLTIDAYGPICDNAGGIAEMALLPKSIRKHKTDPLDAAGNTTAAIGKGFAIGSAGMVSLALFGAFVTVKSPNAIPAVDILDPFVFAGLLFGAMLPYWFSAMTMKSVAEAADEMVQEVKKQFVEFKLATAVDPKPDYNRCVDISTRASLQEMIPPGVLVMLSPLLVGYLLGARCLAGMLSGILVSGVQVAISASNSGGAWDNAKKYVEEGGIKGHGKNTPLHHATVIGDTVGDPLKDTSGPAINILVKLSAIISLVFGSSMPAWGEGGYLSQWLGVSS